VDRDPIYHLTLASELRPGIEGERYKPARFADEGFVHCAQREVVLSVASDYFAGADEPVVLLRIAPDVLAAELRFEAPAPIAGGGRAHLELAHEFPHVYGPIELAAVTGVAALSRSAEGSFAWPARFTSLEEHLAEGASSGSR